MSREETWKEALDKLRRYHRALDKVGAVVFPSETGRIIAKNILMQIAMLHEQLDHFIMEDANIRNLEIINGAILDIIKESIAETKQASNVSQLESFNLFVKECMLGIDTESIENKFEYEMFHTDEEDPGVMTSVFSFGENDIYNDMFLEWHINGTVKAIGIYDNGKPVGVWTNFDDMGNLVSQLDHSKVRAFEDKDRQHRERVQQYANNILFAESIPPEPSLVDSSNEELSLATVLAGSFAALTLSTLLKSKNKNSKQKKVKSKKEVKETVSVSK